MADPVQNVIAVAIADSLVKQGTPSHVAAIVSINVGVAVRSALDQAGYRLIAPREGLGRDD